jgi:group I intron endonuclease
MHQAYFVYKITSSQTDKSYIGISVEPKGRWRQHKAHARRGSGYVLHAAMRKYGIHTFNMTVIAEAQTQNEIFELEKKLIVEHNTLVPSGYNIMNGGQGGGGENHAENMRRAWASKSPEEIAEFKEKMKEVGKDISEETRQLRSVSAKTQHADPTQKATHKAAASKANQDPEKCQRIAEAARKRWSDPAFIAKMKAKYATPEQREKKRKARAIRGTILHTDATKEKIRQAKLGGTLSEEHKDKIRQSMKNYKAANSTA